MRGVENCGNEVEMGVEEGGVAFTEMIMCFGLCSWIFLFILEFFLVQILVRLLDSSSQWKRVHSWSGSHISYLRTTIYTTI
jgi:hypothetical protein